MATSSSSSSQPKTSLLPVHGLYTGIYEIEVMKESGNATTTLVGLEELCDLFTTSGVYHFKKSKMSPHLLVGSTQEEKKEQIKAHQEELPMREYRHYLRECLWGLDQEVVDILHQMWRDWQSGLPTTWAKEEKDGTSYFSHKLLASLTCSDGLQFTYYHDGKMNHHGITSVGSVELVCLIEPEHPQLSQQQLAAITGKAMFINEFHISIPKNTMGGYGNKVT